MPRNRDWIEEGSEMVGRAVRSFARGAGDKEWWIREDRETRQISEDRLRRKLRKGDYSGLELARPDGESEWKPLHAFPIFTEEVPNGGNPERTAALRALRGWIGISVGLVVPAIVFAAVFQQWQWWMIFPLGGVSVAWVAKGIKTLPALMALRGALDGPLLTERRVDGAPLVVAPAPSSTVTADPFLQQLDAALAEVGRALDAAPSEKRLDLAALRKAAEDLHQRRLALTALGGEAAVARLGQDQAETKARLQKTSDARSSAALQEELDAIGGRLTAMREAAEAETRLAARERSLLHQVEALRVSLLRASIEDPSVDQARTKLTEALTRLDQDLAAGDEIDAHLAKTTRTLAQKN